MTAFSSGALSSTTSRQSSSPAPRQKRRLYVGGVPERPDAGDLFQDAGGQLWRAARIAQSDDAARHPWVQVDLVSSSTRRRVAALAAGSTACVAALFLLAPLLWLWAWPVGLACWMVMIGTIIFVDVAVTALQRMVTVESVSQLQWEGS